MIEKILNIIFPTCCGICKRLYKTWICPKCYYKLKEECKYIKILEKDFYIFCVQELKQYDYIIPVPMYIENKNIRGYNQTEVLAESIKNKLKIDYIKDAIVKIKQNKKQSSLSEKERIENVKDVYKIQNFKILKNKRILLLDDIYTTGNTIKACREELKKSETEKIDVLVLAKREI